MNLFFLLSLYKWLYTSKIHRSDGTVRFRNFTFIGSLALKTKSHIKTTSSLLVTGSKIKFDIISIITVFNSSTANFWPGKKLKYHNCKLFLYSVKAKLSNPFSWIQQKNLILVTHPLYLWVRMLKFQIRAIRQLKVSAKMIYSNNSYKRQIMEGSFQS